ncbi:MAG: putative DNA binding domain-containing protein [Clostridiales Family XIII bacterium]|jgi:ATP-dependent DNA helicase RecG|nr:putative DNA binding domain-containing protein [Clostridiales Family XIII bacterium]
MDIYRFKTILAIGETVAVEFKRCGGKAEADTYETVCSFLNRFGGDIYLGVEDNGSVTGVQEKTASEIIKNFISMVSNPDVIYPTVYLSPEVLEHEGKKVVHIHVPPSSEVHSFKKVIYDRVDDADVKVTATGQIAQMYIRKQRIFTEKKVYPYVRNGHLRFDLLPRIRQLAVNRYRDHPWKAMNDAELLQSAGLIGEDLETGMKGYNLAAVMLLGRNEVIKSVSPAYRTDALLRKVNVDRYDDRLIVETNLIDSYNMLMEFAAKHLLDKFYLEGDVRVSLSSVITREMLVNCLIHREFTSSFIAQFVIEKDRMYIANANRAETGDMITPDNFRPNPKNPVIASFFRNIGLADELGSGVRNLYSYGRLYSGKEPQLIDGDVFRIIVPLDDAYSFDAQIGKVATAKLNRKNCGSYCGMDCDMAEIRVLEFLERNPAATHENIAGEIGKSIRTAQYIVYSLKKKGLLTREGSRNSGRWIVKPNI